MSERALQWAKAQRLANRGAQALLELLCDLCDENGHLQAEQRELAELLGVARETVNRRFKVLDALRLVSRYDLFDVSGKPCGQAIFLALPSDNLASPSDNQVTPSDNQVTNPQSPSDNQVTPPSLFMNINTHTHARTRARENFLNLEIPLFVDGEKYWRFVDAHLEAGRVFTFGQMQAHLDALARLAAFGVDPNEALELATQKLWTGFDVPKLAKILRPVESSAPDVKTGTKVHAKAQGEKQPVPGQIPHDAVMEAQAQQAELERELEPDVDDPGRTIAWLRLALRAKNLSAKMRASHEAQLAELLRKHPPPEPERVAEAEAAQARRILAQQAAALARDGP